MRDLVLTEHARRDLAAILTHSATSFGGEARRRYEVLIGIALRNLQDDPQRLGSRGRPELGDNLRTYHLRSCRTKANQQGARVADPRHLLAYQFDAARVTVLRVLHDAMDLNRQMPTDHT